MSRRLLKNNMRLYLDTLKEIIESQEKNNIVHIWGRSELLAEFNKKITTNKRIMNGQFNKILAKQRNYIIFRSYHSNSKHYIFKRYR